MYMHVTSIIVTRFVLINPFTGVGTILRPVRVVCSKNHKKSPEQAIFFLNVPADAEKISLPRGIFARSKSAGCYVVRAVEIDRNLSCFFLTMASRLSVYDVLERLEDYDDGLYSEDESDCEAEGVSGYMPESDASGEALTTTMKKAPMTPLFQRSPLLFAGQYLLLDTIATLSFTSR